MEVSMDRLSIQLVGGRGDTKIVRSIPASIDRPERIQVNGESYRDLNLQHLQGKRKVEIVWLYQYEAQD